MKVNMKCFVVGQLRYTRCTPTNVSGATGTKPHRFVKVHPDTSQPDMIFFIFIHNIKYEC